MQSHSSHDTQEVHYDLFLKNYIYGKLNSSIFFGFIVLTYLVLAYLSDQYILNDEVYIRSFSDLLTNETILEIRERQSWLNYVFIPLTLILKVSFVTVCLSIGAVLSTLDFKFNTIFKVVIIAEGVFVIAHLVYLFNLSQHVDNLTFEIASNYYPLSILSIYGVENVVSWLHYPLQTLNMFEVAYILCISWLLSKQWKPNFIESINIVLPSYGIGLLIWMVLVVFLTLQIS